VGVTILSAAIAYIVHSFDKVIVSGNLKDCTVPFKRAQCLTLFHFAVYYMIQVVMPKFLESS